MAYDQPGMGIEEATQALMDKHRQTPSDSGDAATDDIAQEPHEGAGHEHPDEPDSTPDKDVKDSEVDVDDPEGEDLDPDEGEQPEPDGEGDETTDEFVFTVKDDDGQERGITLEEARNGYLRQQDYTRKTQLAANDRKEVEALKNELTEQKAQLAQALDRMTQSADTELLELQGTDWKRLQEEDPYEYEKKAQRYDALKRSADEAARHRDAVKAEAERDFQAQIDALREAETKQLLSLAPEFDPEQGGTELHQKLLAEAGDRYGFQEAELEQIFDHRALLVLRDAVKYHDLQDKLARGHEKKDRLGKNLRPGAKPDTRSTRKTKTQQKLREKATRSGSLDDAVEYLMSKVNRGGD